MPFREKKAWATIFALLIVFIPYYVIMVQAYHRPDPNIFSLAHLAALALTSFVVLELLLVFIARRLSSEDAGIPRDEREQLFAFRAARVAYTVLIILLVLITFAMIHTEGRNWGWGMLYLMGIIIAEIVRATLLIVQYRRG